MKHLECVWFGSVIGPLVDKCSGAIPESKYSLKKDVGWTRPMGSSAVKGRLACSAVEKKMQMLTLGSIQSTMSSRLNNVDSLT